MDDKPFLEGMKESLREFKEGFDKNSAATGVAAGILGTLGLGVILPDTARSFVTEARGRIDRHHHRRPPRLRPEGEKQLVADALKEEASTFTGKVEEGRTAADSEVKR